MNKISITPEKMQEVQEHIKTLTPPYPGMKRQWVICTECGTTQFYDYTPFAFERTVRVTRCQHEWSKMQEFDPMIEHPKTKTTDTIASLILHAPDLLQEPSLQENTILLGQLKYSMMHYAAEKAQHYAGWIAEQVIAGRTYNKLWNDYLTEHPLE